MHIDLKKRFFINKCSNSTGPSIFGYRLKKALEEFNWDFVKEDFDYNIGFSGGKFYASAVNILRLDGLYYDTENTIGNTDSLNAPIKKAYKTFDKLIFQSSYGRDLFFKHFGESCKPNAIIYNGVPEIFSPDGPTYQYPWAKTFICSASWRKHKRLEAIVEGFNRFDDDNVGLVVLGECKEKINKKNVVYLGNMSPEQLPFYLRGANAFVHLTWLDCCPNSVCEALACGLPVLSSHNGGTKELVKSDGIILELEDEYKFNRVALYKPPVPDFDIVYRGMEDILDWKEKVVRPDLQIDHVAKQYIDFILK